MRLHVKVTAVKPGDPPTLPGPGASRLGHWRVEGTVVGPVKEDGDDAPEGERYREGDRVCWVRIGHPPTPDSTVVRDETALEPLAEESAGWPDSSADATDG